MAVDESALDADLARLRKLNGAKWTRDPEDVLPAWVADMDLPPAPCIDAVLRDLLDRGDFGYPQRTTMPSVAAAFVDWQTRYHGWTPPVERVVPFTDVLHGIDIVLWTNTNPGDGVVLLTPIYPPFIKALESSGRRLIDCPLDPDGWRLNIDVLRSVIDDGTKAILMCNPHNPTGRAFDAEELAGLAAVAEEHDLLVLSDEIWADVLHPGATHIPFANVANHRSVIFSAASKAFNLAGLRCALGVVGSDDVMTTLDGLPNHFRGAVSTPGALATLCAWTEGHEWLANTNAHLTEQRDHLAARLEAELPGVAWQIPEATYLAWLDFRGIGGGDEPATQLMEKGRIALSPGCDFTDGGRGFARLNVATTRPVLDAVIDRLVATFS